MIQQWEGVFWCKVPTVDIISTFYSARLHLISVCMRVHTHTHKLIKRRRVKRVLGNYIHIFWAEYELLPSADDTGCPKVNSFEPASVKILKDVAGGSAGCAVASWCFYHSLCSNWIMYNEHQRVYFHVPAQSQLEVLRAGSLSTCQNVSLFISEHKSRRISGSNWHSGEQRRERQSETV